MSPLGFVDLYVVVMALASSLLSFLCRIQQPSRHFPRINIPVVSVIGINGPRTERDGGRIVAHSERGFNLTVSDIEHPESQSLNGFAVIKIFFRPSANISVALTKGHSDRQTCCAGLARARLRRWSSLTPASSTRCATWDWQQDDSRSKHVRISGTIFLRTSLATVQVRPSSPYGGSRARAGRPRFPNCSSTFGARGHRKAVAAQN